MPVSDVARIADRVLDRLADGGHLPLLTGNDGTRAPARAPRAHVGVVSHRKDDGTDEPALLALVGQALASSVGLRVPTSRAAHRVADVVAVRPLLPALAAQADTGDEP